MRHARILVVLSAALALGTAPVAAQSALSTSSSSQPGDVTITVTGSRGTQSQTAPASQPAPPQPWAYEKRTVLSTGKRIERTSDGGVRYRTHPDLITHTQARGYGQPPSPNAQPPYPYANPHGRGAMIKIPWGPGYEIYLPLGTPSHGNYYPSPHPFPPYPYKQPGGPPPLAP